MQASFCPVIKERETVSPQQPIAQNSSGEGKRKNSVAVGTIHFVQSPVLWL
jgi:hypothetical protein